MSLSEPERLTRRCRISTSIPASASACRIDRGASPMTAPRDWATAISAVGVRKRSRKVFSTPRILTSLMLVIASCTDLKRAPVEAITDGADPRQRPAGGNEDQRRSCRRSSATARSAMVGSTTRRRPKSDSTSANCEKTSISRLIASFTTPLHLDQNDLAEVARCCG